MARYAEKTKVPVERSKAEIEKVLRKHDATGLLMAWDETRGVSVVQFRIADRMVRLRVTEPDPGDFQLTEAGWERSDAAIRDAVAKENRRRWRALLLITKAKLELIESGESTVEREFMPDLLLPDGTTLEERITPKLAAAYDSGKMPRALLPDF